LKELDDMIDEWIMSQLIASDMEYVEHIQRNLNHCNEVLLNAQTGEMDEDPDLIEIIIQADEKAILYKDQLDHLKQTVLVNSDHVYVPKAIGVLSHFPWHDLLKDWLCSMVYSIAPSRSSCDSLQQSASSINSKSKDDLELHHGLAEDIAERLHVSNKDLSRRLRGSFVHLSDRLKKLSRSVDVFNITGLLAPIER
jgi:hypothetical protein